MTQIPYPRQPICHHTHMWECKCAGCRGDNCWGSPAYYGKVGNHGPYWELGLNQYQRDRLLRALTEHGELNTGDWWAEVIHKLRNVSTEETKHIEG